MEKIFAEIDTDAEVLSSSIDLSSQTLMIVHQQFNSRNIPEASTSSHIAVYCVLLQWLQY